MCVQTLLSELCGELQLTHEDPRPRCSYLWKPPSSGSHWAQMGGAVEGPLSDTGKVGGRWNEGLLRCAWGGGGAI